jgi:hypothetical protein
MKDIVSLLMDDNYVLSQNDRMYIIYKLSLLQAEVEVLSNRQTEAKRLLRRIKKYCEDYQLYGLQLKPVLRMIEGKE